jgi:hypothetical protein
MGNQFQGTLWDVYMITHTNPIVEFMFDSAMNKVDLMFLPKDKIINNGASSNIKDAFVSRSSLTDVDWNGFTDMGSYRITQNGPFTDVLHQPLGAYTYGILHVFEKGTNASQWYLPHNNEGLYIRSKFSDNDWSPWKNYGPPTVNAPVELRFTAPFY